MTIFESIRKDHDTQRELLDQLVKTTGDSKQRDKIYKQLKNELNIHAEAEERHFYKPLISNDMMQEKARHGIAEHHEIDELLEQLDDTEYSSSAWLKIAKDLKEKVEHHLEDEEHKFFHDTQKAALAKDYRSYMDTNL